MDISVRPYDRKIPIWTIYSNDMLCHLSYSQIVWVAIVSITWNRILKLV